MKCDILQVSADVEDHSQPIKGPTSRFSSEQMQQLNRVKRRILADQSLGNNNDFYRESLQMLNIATGFEMFSSEYHLRKKKKMLELYKNGSIPDGMAPPSKSADAKRRAVSKLPVCKRIDMIAVEYNNGNYIQNDFYTKEIARSKTNDDYRSLIEAETPNQSKLQQTHNDLSQHELASEVKPKPILRNNLTGLIDNQSKTDLTKSRVQFAEKRPEFFITQVDDLIEQEMQSNEISKSETNKLNLFQKGGRRRGVKLTAKFGDHKELVKERRGAVTDNLLFRTGMDDPKPKKPILRNRTNTRSSFGDRNSHTQDEILEGGEGDPNNPTEGDKKPRSWGRLRKLATASKTNLNLFGMGKAFEVNLFSGINQLTKDFKLSKGLLDKETKVKELQVAAVKNLEYKKRTKFAARSQTMGVESGPGTTKRLLFDTENTKHLKTSLVAAH